jgi:hypothetical protein
MGLSGLSNRKKSGIALLIAYSEKAKVGESPHHRTKMATLVEICPNSSPPSSCGERPFENVWRSTGDVVGSSVYCIINTSGDWNFSALSGVYVLTKNRAAQLRSARGIANLLPVLGRRRPTVGSLQKPVQPQKAE